MHFADVFKTRDSDVTFKTITSCLFSFMWAATRLKQLS